MVSKLICPLPLYICIASASAHAQVPVEPCKIAKQAGLPANEFALDTLGPTPLELAGPEAFRAAANITLKHGYTSFRLTEVVSIAPNCIVVETYRPDTLPKDCNGKPEIDPDSLYNARDVLDRPDELARRNGWK
ncbi:hypothetical protein [Phyllobacterium sp. YR620]|uniref:hypothetical protein n=1 Tax=Phyllobacterium sp. YR620 TaxID=1881066 RepID=UPI0011140603|nr:hypothetical protein [Phyllobacterium sp. YR620]